MLIWLRSIQTYDIAASCRCRRPLCLCNRSRLEMNRTHSGSTQSFPKLRVWGSLLPPPPPGLMENRAASASVDMCCAVRTRDDRQPIYSTAIFPPQIWGGGELGERIGWSGVVEFGRRRRSNCRRLRLHIRASSS